MQEHEILELLKKKQVNIWAINHYKNVKQYNDWRDNDRILTEEEFNILKEWTL